MGTTLEFVYTFILSAFVVLKTPFPKTLNLLGKKWFNILFMKVAFAIVRFTYVGFLFISGNILLNFSLGGLFKEVNIFPDKLYLLEPAYTAPMLVLLLYVIFVESMTSKASLEVPRKILNPEYNKDTVGYEEKIMSPWLNEVISVPMMSGLIYVALSFAITIIAFIIALIFHIY